MWRVSVTQNTHYAGTCQHVCVRKYTYDVLGVRMMLRIGEAREARGWTQAQLAQAIGTTQQTVQRWESGQTDPKITQVEAISNALGITMSFLLGIDEPRKVDSPTLLERELLAKFRAMDSQGRAMLIEQADFLASRHPLNQAHSMGA